MAVSSPGVTVASCPAETRNSASRSNANRESCSEHAEQHQQQDDGERNTEKPENDRHLDSPGWKVSWKLRRRPLRRLNAAYPNGGRHLPTAARIQIATSWRTPWVSMSLPRPRAMNSPRSITR